MAKATFTEEQASTVTTPAAGTVTFSFDTTANGLFYYKDDGGRYYARSTNAAIAAQTANAADTWLTNSDLIIPSFGFQAKTTFLWQASASKTAAGIATPIYAVRVGSARTTSDTARLTITGPAQTAIADVGTLNVMVTVRSIGATGVLQGTAWWDHRGTAANTTTSGVGFANDTTGHTETTAAGFDMTAIAGQFISLSVNPGTAGVWTITQLRSEVDW